MGGMFIVPIIFGVIFLIIFIVVTVLTIKKMKSNKHINELKDALFTRVKKTIVGKDEKSDFVVCEYCGSQNDKKSAKCTSCGASLRRDKGAEDKQ